MSGLMQNRENRVGKSLLEEAPQEARAANLMENEVEKGS